MSRQTSQLVADPSSSQNIGRIEAVGMSSSLTVIVAGTSSAANPKTSAIAGMSVLSSLENESASISFG
ncbi:MAG: hypothetical protein JWQ11_4328 [Rhizobacter sp.]|nr:hypothetical protein [Rhizobacter sp.]